jgi:predicted ArsR family transcriptional regulator
MKSLRASIFDRLLRHPGGQTAAEIAYGLGLPDGRSVAGQLKALEREGRVEVARFAVKNMGPWRARGGTSSGQWFLPSSQRA